MGHSDQKRSEAEAEDWGCRRETRLQISFKFVSVDNAMCKRLESLESK